MEQSRGTSIFLTVLDDCSRATWLYLMDCKSKTNLYVKEFLQMVQIHFQRRAKVI